MAPAHGNAEAGGHRSGSGLKYSKANAPTDISGRFGSCHCVHDFSPGKGSVAASVALIARISQTGFNILPRSPRQSTGDSPGVFCTTPMRALSEHVGLSCPCEADGPVTSLLRAYRGGSAWSRRKGYSGLRPFVRSGCRIPRKRGRRSCPHALCDRQYRIVSRYRRPKGRR